MSNMSRDELHELNEINALSEALTGIAMRVHPPVYEIPVGLWRWCRLDEVRDAVIASAALARSGYEPSIKELIDDFAVLTPRNNDTWTTPVAKLCNIVPLGKEGQGRRLFRYSSNGAHFQAKVVDGHSPFQKSELGYTPFTLDVPEAILPRTFVRADWGIGVANAARLGVVRVSEPQNEPNIGDIYGWIPSPKSHDRLRPQLIYMNPETFEVRFANRT